MTTNQSKIFLFIGGALLFVALSMYIVLVKIPTDLASNVAHGMKEMLNFTPQVRINEHVVIEQSVPVAELATISRDLSVDYIWSHQWLGSTKTLALRGTFTAKAGFDLHEPFRVDIQRFPLKVHAIMPPPKILSLQMNSYNVLRDEDGWWNKISAGDRESAVQELQRVAREKAEGSGMLNEAQLSIEQRIKEIAG
ncbi:MAG: DUF4230 domain-containing protein, partial [bacterium]